MPSFNQRREEVINMFDQDDWVETTEKKPVLEETMIFCPYEIKHLMKKANGQWDSQYKIWRCRGLSKEDKIKLLNYSEYASKLNGGIARVSFLKEVAIVDEFPKYKYFNRGELLKELTAI